MRDARAIFETFDSPSTFEKDAYGNYKDPVVQNLWAGFQKWMENPPEKTAEFTFSITEVWGETTINRGTEFDRSFWDLQQATLFTKLLAALARHEWAKAKALLSAIMNKKER